MSILACPHCEEPYDTDLDVDHEERCLSNAEPDLLTDASEIIRRAVDLTDPYRARIANLEAERDELHRMIRGNYTRAFLRQHLDGTNTTMRRINHTSDAPHPSGRRT